MKYFIMSASPSFVGAMGNWRLTAKDDKEAWDIAYQVAVDYIESYEDISEWEEEHDVEYEYNYHVQEVTKEDYENKYDYLSEIG